MKKLGTIAVFCIFNVVFGIFTKPAKAQETYFIHSGHLGSTTLITKEGTVVEKSLYYPYGNQRGTNNQALGTSQPDTRNPLTEKTYTGQISDIKDTELLYYNARYYNPTLAKFTQADSMGDGLNKYAYVHNNPIIMIDPTGNDAGPKGTGGYLPEEEEEEFDWDYYWGIFTGYDDSVESEFFENDPLRLLENSTADDILGYIFDEIDPTIFENSTEIKISNLQSNIIYALASVNIQFKNSEYNGANISLPLFGSDARPENGIVYGVIYTHELRHSWQRIYDKNKMFSSNVTELAVKSGVIPGNWRAEFVFGDDSGGNNQYTIRPHGSDEIGPITYNRWSKVREVDAIIAETMMNPQTRDIIKTEYPELWNLMLSESGYFNPQYFQTVLLNSLLK